KDQAMTPRRCRAGLATLLIITFVIVSRSPSAAPKYSPWSAPVNLGPVVNSPFGEQGPAISKDALSLYFGSNRPGGSGGFDIWVSQRTNPGDAWGPPVNLGSTVNTASIESIPALSRDEHWMFFNSDRPGGFGAIDLWASWRANIHDDFGWETPVNLGAPVNSAFLDQAASYF